MKTIFLIAILVIATVGCRKEKIPELPEGVTMITEYKVLADSLKYIIQENSDNYLAYPNLFTTTAQKNIELKEESAVFVSFLEEETSAVSSLFYYVYNKSNPPSKAKDLNYEVVFPNVSKLDEGGLLEAGFTVQLGTTKFPAGSVIGFFLVVDGWDDGYIDLDKTTFYTNIAFNNRSKQQHILFKEKDFKDIIIGFEDSDLNDTQNINRDFNDIIFAVSDNNEGNEATTFDLTNVVIK